MIHVWIVDSNFFSFSLSYVAAKYSVRILQRKIKAVFYFVMSYQCKFIFPTNFQQKNIPVKKFVFFWLMNEYSFTNHSLSNFSLLSISRSLSEAELSKHSRRRMLMVVGEARARERRTPRVATSRSAAGRYSDIDRNK